MALQAEVGFTLIQELEDSLLELRVEQNLLEQLDVPLLQQSNRIDEELQSVEVQLMEVLR